MKGTESAGGGNAARYCAACGAPARPDARFCHQCGARLGAAPVNWRANLLPVALLGGLVAVVFAVVLGLAYLMRPDLFQSAGTVAPAPAAPALSSVDLSQMSPREAADRLFNRVMAADERGDAGEAQRFAPMALQAYGRVAELDADAHYHLGLLHGIAGDVEGQRREIAALRQFAPDHLLAFALEHDLAERQGDAAAAARAARALADVYDSEIAAGRPEYEAHSIPIEKLRKAAD